MSDSTGPFRVDVTGAVATITLERPKQLNALNVPLLEGLARELAAIHGNDAVRAVVVTGAGRAFCAGGDLRNISGFGERRSDGFRYGAGVFHQLVLAMHNLGKPVIAAVQGVAAGGGMSLALACDLRVMAEDTFMQPGYLGRGLSPDGGLSFILPRLVGVSRALELAWCDERIDAARCLELGLVSELCPASQVLTRAQALAGQLARGPSVAIARTKALMLSSLESSLADTLERERVAIADCADSPEGVEGLDAFLEKRMADFSAAGVGKSR